MAGEGRVGAQEMAGRVREEGEEGEEVGMVVEELARVEPCGEVRGNRTQSHNVRTSIM
jgi:hypothetical protein